MKSGADSEAYCGYPPDLSASSIVSYNCCIGKIIKLLQQASDENWKCKRKQKPGNVSLCHVQDTAFSGCFRHKKSL